MKIYFKVILLLFVTTIWVGAIAPEMVSANDDMIAAFGVLSIFVYPMFVYKLFKPELEKLKGL